MSFAAAVFALQRGHKVRRRHWTGYWVMDGKEVIMHTHDGKEINIRESEDMLYTLSNMACDDWEIADEDHATRELAQ